MYYNTKPWNCEQCTFNNTKSYYKCDICNYELEMYSLDIPDYLLEKQKLDQNNSVDYKMFTNEYIFLPVIDVVNYELTLKNCQICFENGADGVWLINHSIAHKELLEIFKKIRIIYPEKWIGLNIMDLYIHDIFNKIQDWNIKIDGIWTDNSYINTTNPIQNIANIIQLNKIRSGWKGLYFGSIAFKYHPLRIELSKPENLSKISQLATKYIDVITSSGAETNIAMDIDKARIIKENIKSKALAIASGINIDNCHQYKPYCKFYLVSSSLKINIEDALFDPIKIKNLANKIHELVKQNKN